MCLLFGIGLAAFLALLEKLPIISKERRKPEVIDRKLLYEIWDARKYQLSNEEIEEILEGY